MTRRGKIEEKYIQLWRQPRAAHSQGQSTRWSKSKQNQQLFSQLSQINIPGTEVIAAKDEECRLRSFLLSDPRQSPAVLRGPHWRVGACEYGDTLQFIGVGLILTCTSLLTGNFVVSITRIQPHFWFSSHVLLKLPVPVAQLVQRWTPCGESTRPGYESPRVRGATGA